LAELSHQHLRVGETGGEVEASATHLPHSHRDPHGHGRVAHQFDDAVQQHDTATLGMWTFLATEVLFFGAILLAYATYRHYYFPEFRYASREYLKWYLGAINTAVLLTSSLTVALGVHAAQQGEHKHLGHLLLATIALGLVFLGIKGTEYTIEYYEGAVPGRFFHPEISPQHEAELARERMKLSAFLTPDGAIAYSRRRMELFMGFYFVLTGIHATHMLIGIGLFAWLYRRARRGDFTRDYSNPVEIGGLYWHFVDIVWVFLFPTLYLINPALKWWSGGHH